jgi:microsomal dipeptidase-like Zn-dependent dipeptidase
MRSHEGRRLLLWRIKASLVHFASRFGNYRTFSSGPRVRIDYMQKGGVGVALSVLYSFFAEVDVIDGIEPSGDYLGEIEYQMQRVTDEIESRHGDTAAIVANPLQLQEAQAAGKIALVHCVEGGFHLGPTPGDVRRSVHALADRGVAYITLAHLIWRKVATDAPALPWWNDAQYHRWLPQPDIGLSDLGKAAVEAMVERHVLIDLSHMSGKSIADTFELLDVLDGKSGETTPVLFTHAGFRFGEQEYMLDRKTVEEVHRRKGVIGLIMARHQIEDRVPRRERPRLPRPAGHRFERSFEILCEHIEAIHDITGSYENVAIGSDFDGFIKPTLAGLEDMRDMASLETALIGELGATTAAAICSGNAMGLLTGYWRGA